MWGLLEGGTNGVEGDGRWQKRWQSISMVSKGWKMWPERRLKVSCDYRLGAVKMLIGMVESVRQAGVMADLGGSKPLGGMMLGIGIRGRNSICRC